LVMPVQCQPSDAVLSLGGDDHNPGPPLDLEHGPTPEHERLGRHGGAHAAASTFAACSRSRRASATRRRCRILRGEPDAVRRRNRMLAPTPRTGPDPPLAERLHGLPQAGTLR
jgi:hypothetical protein